MKAAFLLSAYLLPLKLIASGSEGNSFAHFYQTPIGEMIMNPLTFTEGIKTFLNDENCFILSLMINKYTTLFEIGCGASTRATDVVKFGKYYYGIDINPNYITKSLKYFKDNQLGKRAHATCMSALDLNASNFPLPKDSKTLIFFPFNLMGNLDDFHLVIANIIDIGIDFCFSSYKMNDEARASRLGYYTNCGCQHIRYSTTPIGDLFDSQEGLHSASFKNSYIIELIDSILENSNRRAKIQFQDMGNLAYMTYISDIEVK